MDDEGAVSALAGPVRTCIGCRGRYAQRHLVRFVVAGATLVVDASRMRPGRGAYVCWRRACAQRVLKDGRRMARALRVAPTGVTVDTDALLQDWEANRRVPPDADGQDEERKEGDERRAASHRARCL